MTVRRPGAPQTGDARGRDETLVMVAFRADEETLAALEVIEKVTAALPGIKTSRVRSAAIRQAIVNEAARMKRASKK